MTRKGAQEATSPHEEELLRSLRRRLTRFYLLVLVAVLALFELGAFSLYHVVMVRSLDDVNSRMLGPVLAEFEHRHEGYFEVMHELSEVAIGEREHLALLNPKGTVLYARGIQLDPEPPLQPGSYTLRGADPMRLLVLPLERDGNVMAYLRVGQSLVGPERSQASLAWGLALLGTLAVGVAWWGGSWLAKRAVLPVAEAFARERQFTRDASHELRTPLSVILTHAQLAQADPHLSEGTREKLRLIERNARRMSELVGDLLTLGRADVGIHDAAVTFSLEDLVEEEVEALLPLADARGLSISFTATTPQATMRGEPSRIAQAVRNLLENAVRYTDPPARIDVILAQKGGKLALTVSDPGPLLPEADRERIFERFVRLDGARRARPDGSGLGLAISRAVARAHGGDVTLDPEPDRTSFTLWLPVS